MEAPVPNTSKLGNIVKMEAPLPNTSKQTLVHFDLKVFYIRLTNYESTPDRLTVNHIPLNISTVIKANGRIAILKSDCISCSLKRDRIDINSDESTFISTDSIKISGDVRFEVLDGDKLLLFGVLEFINNNDNDDDNSNNNGKWRMRCEAVMVHGGPGLCKIGDLPTAEVYVAGSHEGIPVIFTKSIQLGVAKEALDDDLQLSGYRCYKPETMAEFEYKNFYTESEDELSWFNAGVRVGVGLSLGIFLGIGVGVGVLVRSYQSTARGFKKRLL